MADPSVLTGTETFAEQLLPHSIDAEQAILGSILIDPDSVAVALTMISTDAFYVEQHRQLFTLMAALFGNGQGARIDLVVVLNEAVRQGIFSTPAEGKRYLTALMQNVPSASNIKSYCEIVRENHCRRRLAEVARDLLRRIAEGTESAELLLDSAEQRLFDIRGGRDTHGLIPIRDVMVDTYKHLGDISGPDREKYVGAKTGYPALDSITGGMNNSDLVILAARPGMGKTSFALNLAVNVAKNTKKNVAIYSLEMAKNQLVERMLSTHALVDSYKLRTGRIAPDEWGRLAASADTLSDMTIFLSEGSGITVQEMKAQLRHLRNLGMVVIDYLQLMDAPLKTDNRVLVISDITRKLKLMAKELNIPVLLLSQLNRGVESRTDKRPMMSDLRESGSIEQDADIIMFLYNDNYYKRDKAEGANITECIVAKNRHGETSKVNLVWDPQFTRFSTPEHDTPPPV